MTQKKQTLSSSPLAEQRCVPCKGGTPPLKGKELHHWAVQLGGDWTLVDTHHLEKEVSFPDFKQALAFTQAVGALAEQEDHHPDIYLSWGRVVLKLWTHKIDGLSPSDFILAAKIDALILNI